ncbi:MAG TPA: iron ABC transporter permease [Kiloniellales bacterium]|nr:iron ABC transporter permease [Kiloniellales bacterium]
MSERGERRSRWDAPPRVLLGTLGAAALLALGVSLTVGPAGPMTETLSALFGGGSETLTLVVQEIRLPRTLLGLAIGATLGLAGAALQGYLRNPLAEPGLIGVSAAAALGPVVAFYSGLSAAFAFAMPLGGILGALVAVFLVQALAGRDARSLSLILAGVAVTSFAAALTSLVLNLAPNPFAALEIVFWMMGSLADRSFEHLWLALPFMLAGWILLLGLGRALDALTLGEEAARSLGFDLLGVRQRLVLGTALSVGAATAVAGAIGFVGLVVPHLLRPFVGHRPGRLLLASALGGGVLTLCADIAVRLITPGNELKLGVVTALIGAPFFFALVIRARRRMP